MFSCYYSTIRNFQLKFVDVVYLVLYILGQFMGCAVRMGGHKFHRAGFLTIYSGIPYSYQLSDDFQNTYFQGG